MTLPRITAAFVLAVATMAITPFNASAGPAPGEFEGDLSHAGFALVTWGGGTVEEMEAAAPTASAFWMIGGADDMIGWIVGAPAFANREWTEITEGRALPPNFHLMVVIAQDSPPPTPPAPAATPLPTPTLPPTTSLMYPLDAEPSVLMTYQQSIAAGLEFPGIALWDEQPASRIYAPVTGEITAYYWLEPVCSTDDPTTPAFAIEITTHDGWVVLIQNISDHLFHRSELGPVERGSNLGKSSYGYVDLGKIDPCFLSSERLPPVISLWIDGKNVDPTPYLSPYEPLIRD